MIKIESHIIKIGLFTNPTQPVKRHFEKDNQNGMTIFIVKTCFEKLKRFLKSVCNVKNHNIRPDVNLNTEWKLKVDLQEVASIPNNTVQGVVLISTADNEKTAKSHNLISTKKSQC